MTSSPAEWENNMADIYIDDELDDVIAWSRDPNHVISQVSPVTVPISWR